jgi:hypothetical protein
MKLVWVAAGTTRILQESEADFPRCERGLPWSASSKGLDRSQTTLLPECIDDAHNPVRAIDAFEMLDLAALGFFDKKGDDVIELSAAIFSEFAAVKATTSTHHGDVIIETPDHLNSITLKNTAIHSLAADDFRFA